MTSARKSLDASLKDYEQIYRFVLQLLFNYSSIDKIDGRKITKRVLKEFSQYDLELEKVKYAVSKSITEFVEMTSQEPKLEAACDLLYKKEEIFSHNPLSKTEDKAVEKKTTKNNQVESQFLPKTGNTGTRKVGMNRCKDKFSGVKLRPRDQKVLSLFVDEKVLPSARDEGLRFFSIPKSAFYRIVDKLTKYKHLVKIGEDPIATYIINPGLKKLIPTFLGEGKGRVPVSDSARGFSPNDENNRQNSKRPFPVSDPSVPISSKKKNKVLEYGTRHTSTKDFSSKDKQIDNIDDHIIRSHNFTYWVRIQRKPSCLSKLLAKTQWLQLKHMKNWNYFQGSPNVPGIKAIIQWNVNVIIVRMPEIFGRDPYENQMEANRQLIEIKACLEDEYPGLYLAPNPYKFRQVENKGTHHAWIHHHLALKAKQQNIKLKGRFWEIDSSKGIPEFETIDLLKAAGHLANEVEDYDERSRTGEYHRHTVERVNVVEDQFEETEDNQVKIASALKSNGEALEKTTEIINESLQQQTKLAGGLLTQTQLIHSIQQQFADAQITIIQLEKENLFLQKRIIALERNQQISQVQSQPIIPKTVLSISPGKKVSKKSGLLKQKINTLTEIRIKRVLTFLSSHKGPVSKSQILKHHSMKRNSLRFILYHLRKQGRIQKVKGGYTL